MTTDSQPSGVAGRVFWEINHEAQIAAHDNPEKGQQQFVDQWAGAERIYDALSAEARMALAQYRASHNWHEADEIERFCKRLGLDLTPDTDEGSAE